MNITLTLDDDLVREARKLAADRGTTLTAMVRDYLKKETTQQNTAKQRRQLQALEQSFKHFQFKGGKRTWSREDLHERR